LIDVVEPFQTYSAAEFRRDALQLIEDIKTRGRIPLLVGGTMLYFRALRDGLAIMPTADQSVRSDIALEASDHGWASVHARLKEVDPAAAARIHPNDSQRIQRALEVFIVTGKSMTCVQEDGKRVPQLPLSLAFFAVQPENRSVLHSRIKSRFLNMLEMGLVEEVIALRARKELDSTMASMKVVGYRQIWGYLDKSMTYEDAIEKSIAATRQLAKRQLTWLRSWQDLHTSCQDLRLLLEHLSSML
jgi:tRNA dimethylallyltransferase